MISASALPPRLPLDAARANHLKTDWDNVKILVPWFLGRRFVEPSLEELVPLIDWAAFLPAWQVKGRDALFASARAILGRLVSEKSIKARGVYGFWPANTVGDDIVVYKDDARAAVLVRFHMLRQQQPMSDGRPNLSLADFVAPKDSFAPDYIGAFAVTTGIGLDDVVREYEAQGDDDSAIIARALADGLAEAFAQLLHAQVREDWGHGGAEHSRGIRPAFGDPACPDPTGNQALFRLLHAPEIGINLTESFAMTPAASVSGIYLAHPEAAYFDVGPLGRDQVEDYAQRTGKTMDDAERWLAPNVGY